MIKEYSKKIFFLWFAFTIIFANFETFHFHKFYITIDVNPKITKAYRYSYINLHNCLIENFLSVLSNALAKYYDENPIAPKICFIDRIIYQALPSYPISDTPTRGPPCMIS
jgi:hypothetical protein